VKIFTPKISFVLLNVTFDNVDFFFISRYHVINDDLLLRNELRNWSKLRSAICDYKEKHNFNFNTSIMIMIMVVAIMMIKVKVKLSLCFN
jgi:hypothetical protein